MNIIEAIIGTVFLAEKSKEALDKSLDYEV